MYLLTPIHFLKQGLIAAFTLGMFTACDSGENTQAQEADTTTAVSDTANVTSQVNNSTAFPNTLTGQEKSEGWALLFDGQSTAGWRGYTKQKFPDKGWEVKDGTLAVLEADPATEAGGDIVTQKQYENFDLKFDFKLTPEANSGVVYRVKEIPEAQIWHSAPEYQVIDNEGWTKKDPTFDMKTHRTGDNYDLHGATADYSKPVGEWNEGRIVVNNGRVEHWLNGQQTVSYDINSQEYKGLVKKSKFAPYKEYAVNKKGHIGLQDHGATVYYRNIKIKEL